MSGYYIDADDQRAKARRAEQRLLEHDASRTPRPRRQESEEESFLSSLPPVFRKEGEYATGRDTSGERRAARFRDGLPPPPLEVDPSEIQRVLPPSLPPLVPQATFDQRGSRPPPAPPPPTSQLTWAAPQIPELVEEATPQFRMTPQGLVPVQTFGSSTVAYPAMPAQGIEQFAPTASQADTNLSTSQKKRRKRKQNREQRQTSPAPFPLAVDQPPGPPELVLPTHPELTQTACQAEAMIRMPNGSAHRLRCPLQPFPHPGQPHLIQLADATENGAEVFIGFWLPGE